MYILVIYGSVRKNRQGIMAAKFVVNEMIKRGHEVELIDPKEYDFGIIDLTYREYEHDNKPLKMKELSNKLELADGFIIVSGEYNHSIPPALSNLMNYYFEEYFYRPSGVITYSKRDYGGASVAIQLRTFLAEIGTITIPTSFIIRNVSEKFDENGKPLIGGLSEDFIRFADEFEWYMKVMKDGRKNHERPY